jgi:hypothetical protein
LNYEARPLKLRVRPLFSGRTTPKMDVNQLTDFATRYTVAWCSQNPASVGGIHDEGGSLKINEGVPPLAGPLSPLLRIS